MSDQFTGIKIVALDDEASCPSGQGALLRLVLKLSQSAPSAWSQYFNDAWQQHLYIMKRRASVSGDRLYQTAKTLTHPRHRRPVARATILLEDRTFLAADAVGGCTSHESGSASFGIRDHLYA
jgi:hypothetical protein